MTTPEPLTRRPHASIFKRLVWGTPAFNPQEDTMLMTASNSSRMCLFTPPAWRTAAHRGATLYDACRVLESGLLPTFVKNIIIHMGLNDRQQTPTFPYKPPPAGAPHDTTPTRPSHPGDGSAAGPANHLEDRRGNGFLRETLADTEWFLPLPYDFTAAPVHQRDPSHFQPYTHLY